MKQIATLRLHGLTNEAHFEFMTGLNALIDQFNPAALGIEPLMAGWYTALVNEGEALNFVRKSAATAEIVNADNLRDITLTGLMLIIEANCHHFTPAISQAAKKLKVVTDTYGDISRKTYDEESAAINSLINEFSTAFAGDVAILGLGPWLTELQSRNRTFIQLMAGRYTETAGKTPLRMTSARKETDLVYRQITSHIEALVTINGPGTWQPFIAEINARVERYHVETTPRRKVGRPRKNKV